MYVYPKYRGAPKVNQKNTMSDSLGLELLGSC